METNSIITEANIIWTLWTAMWNGDLDKADSIIENGFDLNLLSNKLVEPKDINNSKKVKEWVNGIRNLFETLKYQTLAGPFVDVQQQALCCHWKATGVFCGKTEYPNDIAGNTFLIEGTDILKFSKGKIQECWTQSNIVNRD